MNERTVSLSVSVVRDGGPTVKDKTPVLLISLMLAYSLRGAAALGAV